MAQVAGNPWGLIFTTKILKNLKKILTTRFTGFCNLCHPDQKEICPEGKLFSDILYCLIIISSYCLVLISSYHHDNYLDPLMQDMQSDISIEDDVIDLNNKVRDLIIISDFVFLLSNKSWFNPNILLGRSSFVEAHTFRFPFNNSSCIIIWPVQCLLVGCNQFLG